MQYLQFPAKWRGEIITESDFHAFLEGDIMQCGRDVELLIVPDELRTPETLTTVVWKALGSQVLTVVEHILYTCAMDA